MLERGWQHRGVVAWLLYPISLLFAFVAAVRRQLYQKDILKSYGAGAPIIVVGNITVGGSGKTPLVLWLCRELQRLGKSPGIISRGYGGKSESWPQAVTATTDPYMVGDEAVLLAQRSGCPMVVGPDRVAAAQMLHAQYGVDLIISDDGLQHYRMQRELELAVVDGVRRFGNGWLLPAGPLREPVSRLQRVDFVINNGGVPQQLGQHFEMAMSLQPQQLYNLKSGESSEISEFIMRFGSRVHAVAGIGHPARLFRLLSELGFTVNEHPFADHHPYQQRELLLTPQLPIIMTEKDAVKCQQFNLDNLWVLPVEAVVRAGFAEEIIQQLEKRYG
jgi:tetraacyldisaccharide 4'-kinase